VHRQGAQTDAVAEVMKLTDSVGIDCVIEAVGVPATFALCEVLVAPGDTIANVGVQGVKCDLHLEKLWDRNVSITTRLVDTVSTPILLKTVRAGVSIPHNSSPIAFIWPISCRRTRTSDTPRIRARSRC
jgi:threonine dehydrogenase-like Zn-dependent dehydrogenase